MNNNVVLYINKLFILIFYIYYLYKQIHKEIITHKKYSGTLFNVVFGYYREASKTL